MELEGVEMLCQEMRWLQTNAAAARAQIMREKADLRRRMVRTPPPPHLRQAMLNDRHESVESRSSKLTRGHTGRPADTGIFTRQ